MKQSSRFHIPILSRAIHALTWKSGWAAVPLAAFAVFSLPAQQPAFQTDLPAVPRPWTTAPAGGAKSGFSFTVFGDRTGLVYPGGIEKALGRVEANAQSGKFHASFVISVGDNIEGYNRNAAEVTRMWEDFDARIQSFAMPFFRMPGNHDLSNPVMRDVYQLRYGRPYYYFVYNNVLFLALDTEDPPGTLPEEREIRLATSMKRIVADAAANPDRVPEPLTKLNMCDTDTVQEPEVDAVHPHFSPEQIGYFLDVLARFPKVRWTFVFMHRPMWREPREPGFERIQKALAGRNHTVFAGHIHQFRHETIAGRDYYTLGPTAAIPRCANSADDLNQIVNVSLEGAQPVVQPEMLVPVPPARPDNSAKGNE
jgi:hypothetical protein